MTRIAVVEDNPDNRLLVRAILEHRFTVADYETGDAALTGFQANPPDVILLDISLPGMDGLEVLRRVRADAELSDIPVIALTAYAMDADRKRLLEAGFDDYVAKPITSENVLFDAIRGLLDRNG